MEVRKMLKKLVRKINYATILLKIPEQFYQMDNRNLKYNLISRNDNKSK